jgi:hypothetical protein
MEFDMAKQLSNLSIVDQKNKRVHIKFNHNGILLIFHPQMWAMYDALLKGVLRQFGTISHECIHERFSFADVSYSSHEEAAYAILCLNNETLLMVAVQRVLDHVSDSQTGKSHLAAIKNSLFVKNCGSSLQASWALNKTSTTHRYYSHHDDHEYCND